MKTIYVASKSRFGPMWQKLLRDEYPEIISTWIHESGQGMTLDWGELWTRCIEEASRADSLVLYDPDRDHLKGTLVEVGASLAHGHSVYYVGQYFNNYSFLAHPRVIVSHDLDNAMKRAADR